MAFLLALMLFGGLTPGFAERYEPQLELSSPSETLDQPERFTRVEELEPDQAAGYMQMQLAAPEPAETVPTLQGRVDIEKTFEPDVVFDITHTLPKGEKLILTIMDLIATGYSQEGDEFNARVKEPVMRDGQVLVPKGALVKGHLLETREPGKALSKKGSLTLAFDYILMPDGRKVPFKSEFEKGDNALKAMGRAVGGGIGGTLGGAVRGVLMGLKFGGLAGATATNGATMMVGGGLGALSGLGNGLSRSGDHVLLNEGDEIKVALQEPLQLPVINIRPDTENEIQAPGLTVAIIDYQLGRDPFKVENMINLALQVDNQTEYSFGSFDVALLDEYNNVYALSPFGRDGMLVFQIPAGSQLQGQACFSVKSPDIRHYLVFFKPYTREIVAKISLTEALKKLSAKPSNQAATRKGKATGRRI